MLTLLKQARAFGLGVVLATQNPVDLDYKGLANTGTWFLGRLQTERDRNGCSKGSRAGRRQDQLGSSEDREILTSLEKRVFLMQNVHEDAPVIFQTRWALSYLRGPLTRDQIKQLMADRRPASPASRPASAPAAAAPGESARRRGRGARAGSAPPRGAAPGPCSRPASPSTSCPSRGRAPAGAALVYQPTVLGAATVRFADAKAGVEQTEEIVVAAPITDAAGPGELGGGPADRRPRRRPRDDARGRAPSGRRSRRPPPRRRATRAWSRDLARVALRAAAARAPPRPRVRAWSPGPARPSATSACASARRPGRQRDERVEALRKKYAPKIAALEERLRRAAAGRKHGSGSRSSQQGVQAAISLGATILGAVLGRKTVSVGNIGRATTAARGAGARPQGARGRDARAGDRGSGPAGEERSSRRELQSEMADARGPEREREQLETVALQAEEDRRPGAPLRARVDALLARLRGRADARLDVSPAPVDRPSRGADPERRRRRRRKEEATYAEPVRDGRASPSSSRWASS